MPKIEEYQLHPLGWENDPEEERFKLSTLDYLSAKTYNNYALFFKLNDSEKPKVASVLKQGLERTLSQARHLVGTIEKDPGGDHSFVKRKASTVKFIVQHLDEPGSTFPSFTDIERSHFVSTALGDIRLLSNSPMTFAEGKPEADPDNSPVVSSYKANFIPGGLIFNMHSHHYSNDVVGWSSFTKQLAANCSAIINNSTSFPPWDPACLDRSRTTAPVPPSTSLIDAPPQPPRHPSLRPSQSLLFHLPKSAAIALKSAATPPESSLSPKAPFISTYDAISALLRRTFTRLRIPLYLPPSPSTTVTPLWAEGINLTKRLTSPPLPPLIQGNNFLPVLSTSPSPPFPTPLTIPEITGTTTTTTTTTGLPLSHLALYVRQMTASLTPHLLTATLSALAPIRNKKDISTRVDSFPPLSVAMTDWRDADVCQTADFGWGRGGKPRAFRHLFDRLADGLVIVYPARFGGEEEGIELQVALEKELVAGLVADEEWNRYFEFRGVDAEERTGSEG